MAIYSDIQVDQGADFSVEVTIEDATGNIANLTGYTVAGQIRKSYSSSTATNFSVSISNAAKGEITATLSNTTTAAMKAGRYLYDIEITKTSGGVKTRVIEGQVTVNPGITQI